MFAESKMATVQLTPWTFFTVVIIFSSGLCSVQSESDSTKPVHSVPVFGNASDVAGCGHPEHTVWHPKAGSDEGPVAGEDQQQNHSTFAFRKSSRAFGSEAGELRILSLMEGHQHSYVKPGNLKLGFLSLEPNGLLLPHYADADCLFLVHKGKGRFSWIDLLSDDDNEELNTMDLEEGDFYWIERGSLFHFLNTDEGQRLYIFSIHDIDKLAQPSKSILHNYFVVGRDQGRNLLSGFTKDVLATSFNVSKDHAFHMVNSQVQAPIVFSAGVTNPTKECSWKCSFVNILTRYMGIYNMFSISENSHPNKPYNILKKTPNFSNEYGSAAAVDGLDCEFLKHVNKGVFSVKLKAGAILAPHWNPRATEICLVTKGEGEIHIVYPNGTSAASEKVSEGMVFYVPKNFPMCHIASRSGPFEFVGFSTSSRTNYPQYLSGMNSVLHKWDLDVLALSFNISFEHVKSFLDSQREVVIVPGQPVEPEPSLPRNA